MKRDSIKKDIAIIGISCRFMHSESPLDFWKNLENGNELLCFYSDQELEALGVSKAKINDANFVKINSFIQGTDCFDYPFFGYTKDEANLMDPQIRVMHELVWSAIENAGIVLSDYKEKIGLYLTASDNLNWIAHGLSNPHPNVDPFQQSNIINKNYISSLISYNLNLKGPSYLIDTACSSSLATVHIACRNLLLRECSIAIAGGICLDTTTDVGYFYEEGMIASKDGFCRAFDYDSTGTTKGEGGGLVVLKRLEDALNDGDHIYAVIRSSTSNNDGKRKVGYTAPSVLGQADCIKMAHSFANIDPSSISYIETHGTGTKLGDPVEVEALNKAFNHDTSFNCAIGSVKTNMGHLDYAAGIAGLIKTTLAIQNKVIPPSLHYTKANPEIDFSSGPFYVITEAQKWLQSKDNPIRAGVSSFGIGGTNVHVVLEEEIDERLEGNPSAFQLITYSSKSKESAINYSKKLLAFSEKTSVDLPNLAYTLNTSRESFQTRNFIVAQDVEDFKNQLSKEQNPITNSRLGKKVVFMFSGQGSQYFQMGKELYEQEPYFKKLMDSGFTILEKLTDKDYKEILGYLSKETKESELLNQTQHTQPALFLLEYSLARFLIHLGIEPSYLIGHSLGEYVAACVGEVYTLEEGLKIIVKRAILMGDLPTGDMISVGKSEADIALILPSNLSIAAVNTDHTCVVSGEKERVDLFVKVLEEKEIPYTKLKTSHAFHSEMMDEMLEEFEAELSKVNFSKTKYPIVSNLNGKLLEETFSWPSYLTKHLRNTVRFNAGLDFLLEKEELIFIEIGPGNALANFCKQNKNYSQKSFVTNLLKHNTEEINGQKKFLTALGQLWCNGLKIKWECFYEHQKSKKIAIPTYSFDQYKLDYKVNPFQKISKKLAIGETDSIDDWLYIPNWKKASLRKKDSKNVGKENYLLLSEQTPLIDNLYKELLQDESINLISVRKGKAFTQIEDTIFEVNPNIEKDFQNLFSKLEDQGIICHKVIFNWTIDVKNYDEIIPYFLVLKNLCKFLISHFPEIQKKIILLNDFNYPVFNQEEINISKVSTAELVNVCAQENPMIFSCLIDVNQQLNNKSLTDKIIDDLKYNYSDKKVVFRNNERWIMFFDRFEAEDHQDTFIKNNQTYLITGGLGEVAGVLHEHLVKKFESKIILIGRSFIPDESKWDSILKENKDLDVIGKIKKLQNLKSNHQNIFYYSCDISDRDSFKTAVSLIEKEHGTISGIIHTAGNIDDRTFKPVENITEDVVKMQFDPKVKGTINIYEIFKDKQLDFVWITSSLASILGGLTYGSYAVANNFIDTFLISKREELKNWFGVNLDGISEGRINHQKLIQTFEKSFSILDLPQLIVSVNDPNTFIQYNPEATTEDEKHEDVTLNRQNISSEYIPPLTQIEKELCELWESFFGYNQIGIQDNFFEFGGDSLKAMTILKRIHKTHQVEIGIEEFFLSPTIKSIAQKIETISKVNTIQSNKGSKTITI